MVGGYQRSRAGSSAGTSGGIHRGCCRPALDLSGPQLTIANMVPKTEFAERRRRFLETAGSGVAIFASTPIAVRNNDVEHEYRQDSDLYYLTGFDEPDSVLVLTTEHAEHRCVLFVRPRDKERETWDGPRAGLEGAVAEFGADVAFPIAELPKRL